MPRFSSLRSGLLLTLFLAVSSWGTFAFAQMDYAAMDAAKLGGMSGAPGTKDAMGASSASQGLIANVGSGIKRAGSSLGNAQALFYGDALFVARLNATKIDYESLAKFVDDVVDKAGGSVRSDDKYLVQLRDYQKSSAKSSFTTLLSTVQNTFVQRCFSKKIDEAYYIVYKNDKGDGCEVLAFPTDGLSEAEQKTALDAISSFELFKPVTIFKRYGFIVAVLSHDAAEPFDLESLQETYLAKMKDEQRGSAYGSYGASNGANNGGYGASNAYGANGSEYGGGMRQSLVGGSNMSGFGASRMGDSQNAVVQNPKYPNFGLSPELYAEYLQEAVEAGEKAADSARKSVLPYIRRRFEKPATAEDSKALFDALRQVDGAAFSVAFVNLDAVKSLVEKKAESRDDAVTQPFSALGSDDERDSADMFATGFDALNVGGICKSTTLALSLVGAPKLVCVTEFSDEDAAKTGSDAVKGALALAKTKALKDLDEVVSKVEMEEKVDLSPLVNAIFDALNPQVQGSKVAVVLDFAPVQENAALLLPILGGTETKSALEQETEEIDWSLGEEKKVDDSASSTDSEEQAASKSEDDPFAEPATDASKAGSAAEDEEEDPFGADEEDPFGE